jgi:hypothetical protein
MPNPESVTVNGANYWVCAKCRYPVQMGKAFCPCYYVVQPGAPSPGANPKQALCRDCYHAQFKRVNPGTPLPVLEDGKLTSHGPVPRGARSLSTPAEDEYALWGQALDRARASKGAETVQQAYRILSGQGMEVTPGVAP